MCVFGSCFKTLAVILVSDFSVSPVPTSSNDSTLSKSTVDWYSFSLCVIYSRSSRTDTDLPYILSASPTIQHRPESTEWSPEVASLQQDSFRLATALSHYPSQHTHTHARTRARTQTRTHTRMQHTHAHTNTLSLSLFVEEQRLAVR